MTSALILRENNGAEEEKPKNIKMLENLGFIARPNCNINTCKKMFSLHYDNNHAVIDGRRNDGVYANLLRNVKGFITIDLSNVASIECSLELINCNITSNRNLKSINGSLILDNCIIATQAVYLKNVNGDIILNETNIYSESVFKNFFQSLDSFTGRVKISHKNNSFVHNIMGEKRCSIIIPKSVYNESLDYRGDYSDIFGVLYKNTIDNSYMGFSVDYNGVKIPVKNFHQYINLSGITWKENSDYIDNLMRAYTFNPLNHFHTLMNNKD